MSSDLTSEQMQQIYISNLHGRKRQQPLHTCLAHVFHIDPQTKKSWVPASTSAVPVSFFYDGTRGLYRIISVEGNKPVINCTVTTTMNFTKTSQKFGQWADSKVNTVYGLGFPTESEIDKFQEHFQEIKDSIRLNMSSPNKTAAVTTTTTATNGIGKGTIATMNGTNGVVVVGTNGGGNNKVTPDSDESPQGNNMITTNQLQQRPSVTNGGGIDVNANSLFPLRRPNLAGEGSPYKIRMESPKRIQYLEKLEVDGRMTPETQLKYENEKLRQALQQSSSNAKMWELELSNLKANNMKLTTALQECTYGVEEWKHQLELYQEDNQRLRQKTLELEAAAGNTTAAGELQKQLGQMREQADHFTKLLKQRDEEISLMKDKLANGGESNETELIWKTLQKTQAQLQLTVETHSSQRKALDGLSSQLGEKLMDLNGIKERIRDVLQSIEYKAINSASTSPNK